MNNINDDTESTQKSKSKKHTKLSHIVGYIFLFLSCVAWILVPIIPFLELSGKTIAWIIAGLLISAEVLFWISVLLLGKKIIAKIKGFFFRKK